MHMRSSTSVWMPSNCACRLANFSRPTSSAYLPEMYTISVLLASSGEMYFSLSAWTRVRDSSQFCFGRRKEAAVGDLLLPMGEYQSLS